MAMGLCNSMWSTSILPVSTRLNSVVTPRFLLYLHLYYNESSCITEGSSNRLVMRSVCSNIDTFMGLSSSQHAITSLLLGYISGYNTRSRVNTSMNLYSLMQHSYSCLSTCGSASILATLCGLSVSNHSLSLHLSQIGRYAIDACDFKISTLGKTTCITILIHTHISSSTSIYLPTTLASYLFNPSQGRITDIGYISISTQLGLLGIKVAITL